MEEGRSAYPEPKRLASLKPEDMEAFASVVAWRILERSAGISLRMHGEMDEVRKLLAAKPQTLVASDHVEGNRFRAIANRYREITGRSVGPMYAAAVSDSSSYILLEPLAEEELRAIEGTASSPNEPRAILYPHELREIVETKNVDRL